MYGAARNPESEGIQKLQQQFPERFTPVRMDVTDGSSIAKAAESVAGETESLDLLVNNAGMAATPDEKRIEDIDEDDVAKVFDVNTLGPLRVLKAFVPLLRKSEGAKVVMISSSAGSISGQGGGRGVPYCVSKGALNMLTKLLSFHCREDGMPIVAIHPGWVRTDMGGSGASLSVQESVASMMQVIDELTTDSPLYVDCKGREMSW